MSGSATVTLELEQFDKPQAPQLEQGRSTGHSLRDAEDTAPIGHAQEDSDSPDITRLTKWRVFSNCMMSFGGGLNDSAPGALIPHMETHYGIGYAIVSLIFVTNAVGFICAAPLTDVLQQRLGRSGAYAVSQALMAVGYIVILCTPPYALVVAAFFFIGLGEALGLALNNVFCANVGNGTTALSFLHGSYGLGGTLGPLIATAMASHGILWSRFYGLALAIVSCNGLYSASIFRGYQDEHHGHHQTSGGPSQDAPAESAASPAHAAQATAAEAPSTPLPPTKTVLLKRALRSPITLLGALFIFAYQGAEVSISGWVISFLVAYRHGDLSAVGYVTAGFWGGITVGRFVLSPLAYRVGEKHAVAALTLGSLVFQILVWVVPSIVGNAVVVALIGLFLGPVYPCAAAIFSRLLPRNLQIVSLGFISSAGSSGGAVAPLVTGLVAQRKGTWVLHPICIGLYGVMLASWAGLPRMRKRRD